MALSGTTKAVITGIAITVGGSAAGAVGNKIKNDYDEYIVTLVDQAQAEKFKSIDENIEAIKQQLDQQHKQDQNIQDVLKQTNDINKKLLEKLGQ